MAQGASAGPARAGGRQGMKGGAVLHEEVTEDFRVGE